MLSIGVAGAAPFWLGLLALFRHHCAHWCPDRLALSWGVRDSVGYQAFHRDLFGWVSR